MTHIVTAPAVVAYQPDGSHRMFYKDDVLPKSGLREKSDLYPDEKDRLVKAGLVKEVDEAAHIEPGSDEDPGTGAKPGPVSESAAKTPAVKQPNKQGGN